MHLQGDPKPLEPVSTYFMVSGQQHRCTSLDVRLKVYIKGIFKKGMCISASRTSTRPFFVRRVISTFPQHHWPCLGRPDNPDDHLLKHRFEHQDVGYFQCRQHPPRDAPIYLHIYGNLITGRACSWYQALQEPQLEGDFQIRGHPTWRFHVGSPGNQRGAISCRGTADEQAG
jgi:hypothetical protein